MALSVSWFFLCFHIEQWFFVEYLSSRHYNWHTKSFFLFYVPARYICTSCLFSCLSLLQFIASSETKLSKEIAGERKIQVPLRDRSLVILLLLFASRHRWIAINRSGLEIHHCLNEFYCHWQTRASGVFQSSYLCTGSVNAIISIHCKFYTLSFCSLQIACKHKKSKYVQY